MIRDDELIERGAEIFRGLGHPSRLFIVSRLGESREMCVGELTEMIGDDVSTGTSSGNGLVSFVRRKRSGAIDAM